VAVLVLRLVHEDLHWTAPQKVRTGGVRDGRHKRRADVPLRPPVQTSSPALRPAHVLVTMLSLPFTISCKIM
jgi:hypothetical protein